MSGEKSRYCPQCFEHFADVVERCPDDDTRLVDLPGSESLVGQVLDDKYTIEDKIGQGGMGTVYRARQKFIDREVALKVLRPELVQEVSAAKRFFVEARAVSTLKSRHSVILHDFGVTSAGLLYYTMELLDGEPLSRLLNRVGAISAARAVAITTDVCRSLHEAHELGIVHRDLKPDNIMLVMDDGQQIAKVLDFGVAKLLTAADSTTLTVTGMVCGTPAYMSPEQATGAEVAPASDIYSLGVVLYEMLAGFPPFQATTPAMVLMQHVQEIPRPLDPSAGVPPGIEKLLSGMLAKDPGARPEGVDAVRRALEAIPAASLVSPVDPEAPTMVSASAAPTRPAEPLTPAVSEVTEPAAAPAPAVSQSARGKTVWAILGGTVVLVAAMLAAFYFGRQSATPEKPEAPAPIVAATAAPGATATADAEAVKQDEPSNLQHLDEIPGISSRPTDLSPQPPEDLSPARPDDAVDTPGEVDLVSDALPAAPSKAKIRALLIAQEMAEKTAGEAAEETVQPQQGVNKLADGYMFKKTYHPSLCTLDDGKTLLGFKADTESGSEQMRLRRFDPSGALLGAAIDVAEVPECLSMGRFATAAFPGGGFGVAWYAAWGGECDSHDVLVQRYGADGSAEGDRLQVDSWRARMPTTDGLLLDSGQAKPSLAPLSDGSFVVLWEGMGKGDTKNGAYVRVYDRGGRPVGERIEVSNLASGDGYLQTPLGSILPTLIAFGDGTFLVTFEYLYHFGEGPGTYAQMFDSAGTRREGPIHLLARQKANAAALSLVSLDRDGFLLAWTHTVPSMYTLDTDVHAQRFSPDARAVGPRLTVNSYRDGVQGMQGAAALARGGFVVAWFTTSADGQRTDVAGQLYNREGTQSGREFNLNGSITAMPVISPAVTGLPDGRFAVAWDGYDKDQNSGVRVKFFPPPILPF